VVGAYAMKNLLQLGPTTDLVLGLYTDHWPAAANGILQGRCNSKHLNLDTLQGTSLEDTEAVKAIAGAIRLDRSLERLGLQIMNNFTDEAAVALAEALTANKTLRKITLSLTAMFTGTPSSNTATLGAHAYEAFGAMLCVNTSRGRKALRVS
jgi:hypothetical protein